MVWEMRLSLSGQSTLRANLNKNRIKVTKYTATSIGQKVLLLLEGFVLQIWQIKENKTKIT